MPHHLVRAHHRQHPLVQLLRHPHRHGSPHVLRMLEAHGQRPRLQSPRYGGGRRRHRGVPRQRRRVEIKLPYQLLNRRLHGRSGHGRPLRRRRAALLLARHLLNPAATGSKRLRPPVTSTRTQFAAAAGTRGGIAAACSRSKGAEAPQPSAGWRRSPRAPTRVCGGGEWRILRSWGGGLVDFPSLPAALDCPLLSLATSPLSFSPTLPFRNQIHILRPDPGGDPPSDGGGAAGQHPAARIHRCGVVGPLAVRFVGFGIVHLAFGLRRTRRPLLTRGPQGRGSGGAAQSV